MNPYYDTAKDIRGRLGMVVPVWYPEDVADTGAAELLAQTLEDVEVFCAPDHVAVVVDGQERVAPLAEAAADRLARKGARPHVICKDRNQGKGAAVRDGLERLLSATNCEAMVVRDSDADHCVNDLPSLFRLLHQMREESGTDCVMVVGARADRCRPMGLVRGETERWLVDFFWHAAQFALAVQGRVVDTTFLGPYGPAPDLLSGFKMYSRAAAELAVDGLARAMAEHDDLDMGRYGCELVPPAETLLAGGVVGQMIRGTLEGQPCSGFAQFDPVKMCSHRLLWTARRFRLDGAAACRLFDNACARSPLSAEADMAAQFAKMREILAAGLDFEPPSPTISAFC